MQLKQCSEKFIAISYIKQEDKSQTNKQCFHLMKVAKEEQSKPKANRG
jgi:hypothetical protein